jgi:glycosyltransferase 2 family protein
MAGESAGATARRRLRARHAAVVAGALALGALLVVLVFFSPGWRGGPTLTPRFELRQFLERLPAHLGWLLPFVALLLPLPVARALVWRVVLPHPPPRYADAYHATALGAFVHNVVPGKLGPLAAAWVLARMARRPFAPAFSAQLVAKLLELGAIVALGSLAAASRASGAAVGRAVLAGAALFAALSAAALVLGAGAPRAAARIARRWPRAGDALAALGEGVAGAGTARRLASAVAVAALPALLAAAAYGVPLRAFGVAESVAGGALLLAVIAFGQFTPGLPIGAGVYWSLAAWAARELGAGAADAAALAILTHAGTVGVNLVVGGASAVVRRADVAELFRRRREVERLAGREGPGARAPTSRAQT